MLVAPLTVLGNSLRNFSIVQGTELIEAQIQGGDPQLAAALSDFTG
jgi:hypothetical protein